MSSSESSGAPAEGTATNPAPASPAAPASFGSTRGSGLARGKRPSNSPASQKPTAAASDYKPTAIEIVNAPREYQNPFAPAESTPAEVPESVVKSVSPQPAPASAAPVRADVPPTDEETSPAEEPESPAELNILPPERPKAVEAQTWESTGFTGAEPRADRPRREYRRDDRPESSEPIDPAAIPEKFLYVRPGVNFVPTDPNKWGPGRRDRAPEKAEGHLPRDSAPRSAAAPAAPAKSGGFFGWIKSLFGGGSSSEPAPASQANGDLRSHRGGRRHHRGGAGPGEPRSEGGPRPGGGRRRRGGRGRGPRSDGGSMAT